MELGSCSARYPSPTEGALRALARLLQEGWRSPLLIHSLRVVVKQSPAWLLFVCLMASNVPAMSPNCKPMLYHLAHPSHTASRTEAKSFSVRISISYSNKSTQNYTYTLLSLYKMASMNIHTKKKKNAVRTKLFYHTILLALFPIQRLESLGMRLLLYVPYRRKYWRELNLAVGSEIAVANVLVDLNLAVQYRIAICIYASKKFWQILIWRLLKKTAKHPNLIPCQIFRLYGTAIKCFNRPTRKLS